MPKQQFSIDYSKTNKKYYLYFKRGISFGRWEDVKEAVDEKLIELKNEMYEATKR